ncbi:sirohydrochlorin chelatase [Oerskovia flava]|uniref:sirohydrochlorin chelatase n=1 Tax=Oerskovia flava TaxID=2986422 RepID=UPI002240C63B|nr:CbiX/SirB N-terminal domain-containing protein [Oerskovia sp. JB1-3-2]
MTTEILAFPSSGSPSDEPSAGAPVLVGCSHGTSDESGRAAIRALLDDVRAARPDLTVHEAFVDVQQPEVGDVVTEVVTGTMQDAVVVPLLLSGGFHVDVDITESVAGRGEESGPGHGRASAARPLGPDDRLVDLLAERLAEAGLRPDDAVVIAAAGSSRAGAARDVEQVAAGLRERHTGPVTVGYGAMAKPSVPDAITAARADGRRVVVAAYLLAPGFFYDRVLEAGADLVSAPLAPDARLTAIVLDRYADAAAVLGR